ncbi:MAG TPA: GntR family transcriptional regulator [Micromonospora sp.]
MNPPPGQRPPLVDDQFRDRQRQIAADLRALILSGDIAPGEQLPSTDQLVKRYGVNNLTVQRALRALKAEGTIEARQGVGMFSTMRRPYVVRASHYPKPAPAGEAYPWISDAARRQRKGSSQLIEVGEVPAPAQPAAAFGIAKGDPVVLRHQILSLDGEPAELVWSYYPVDIARGTQLTEHRLIKGGTPRLLTDLGFPPRRAVDQVSPRMATVEEFVALRLPADLPVLRQFRVVFSDDKRPVEATVIVTAGHLYEAQYVLPEE